MPRHERGRDSLAVIRAFTFLTVGMASSTILPHLLLMLLLLQWWAHVSADCECGYAASIDGAGHVFTDLIETDFTRIGDVSRDTDWVMQEFNLTAERARGGFGEMFALDDITGAHEATGGGVDNEREGGGGEGHGGGAGLRLTVRSRMVGGMVPGAEIDSGRTDLLWGTFRAGMKLTDVPGTCAAFFWVSFVFSPYYRPQTLQVAGSDFAKGGLEEKKKTKEESKDRDIDTSFIHSTSTTLRKSTWNFSPKTSTGTIAAIR